MIWLDLKEAGDFHFQSAVKKVSSSPPRISVVCPRVTPPACLFLPGFRRKSGQAFYLRMALPSRALTASFSPTDPVSLWESALRLLPWSTCIPPEIRASLLSHSGPSSALFLQGQEAPVGERWRFRLCRVHARPDIGGLPVHDRTRKNVCFKTGTPVACL